MDKATFEKGLEIRKSVLGADFVEKSFASADEFNKPFQEFVTEYCWGACWGREVLSKKTRSMLNLAMISALNRPHELKMHVKGALTNGVTRDEMREIFFAVAVYCGVPGRRRLLPRRPRGVRRNRQEVKSRHEGRVRSWPCASSLARRCVVRRSPRGPAIGAEARRTKRRGRRGAIRICRGCWPGTDFVGVPLQRASNFGERNVLTEEEFKARQAAAARQTDEDNADFNIDKVTSEQEARGTVGGPVSPPPHWLERGRPSYQASLIVDPPDGRMPPQTPEAAERVRALRAPCRAAARPTRTRIAASTISASPGA